MGFEPTTLCLGSVTKPSAGVATRPPVRTNEGVFVYAGSPKSADVHGGLVSALVSNRP